MAYKQKSGLQFKGLFDNLKRAVTAKKVITQDLESKSNPFTKGTNPDEVRVHPGEGHGFWSMPKEEYIKQASKVYRKTGLKPTEGTRDLSIINEGKTSYFKLPESDNISVEIGERTSRLGREITMTAEKAKKNKPKKVKVKKIKVKTPNSKYRIGKSGKQKLYKGYRAIK
tara:strand:+ start:258 stop:767 length:510 start_codon:yes stop_codon:yes gene_type:complete